MGKPFGWEARQARKSKNLQQRKREIDAAGAAGKRGGIQHPVHCDCKFKCPECGAGFPKWAGKGAVSCNNHLRETGHAAGSKAADCKVLSCRAKKTTPTSLCRVDDTKQQQQQQQQIKGGSFRCPDCSEMFVLWKDCLAHCSVQQHGGWPRAKGQ